MTSSMDFFATALELAGAALPEDRTIDAISFVGVLKAKNCGANGQDYGNRTTFYYWGKNPSPSVGLHAVRHSTASFGNFKLHWCQRAESVCSRALNAPISHDSKRCTQQSYRPVLLM